MKGLPNLIRLHKRRLEEQQRKLVELESLKQGFADRVHALDAEIAEEGRNCADSPETGHVLGSFVQAGIMRRRRLEESIREVQVQIEEFRDQVAEAFQELKRFELVLENSRQRERKTAQRRERNLEDEMGINMFRRQRT